VLNQRQARWAQELAGIDFRLYYRPGTQNGKPDMLSRHPEYRPEKGGTETQPITTVLQKKHLDEESLSKRQGRSFICSTAQLASLPIQRWAKEFIEEVQKEAREDVDYRQGWAQVEKEAELENLDRKGRERILTIQDPAIQKIKTLGIGRNGINGIGIRA